MNSIKGNLARKGSIDHIDLSGKVVLPADRLCTGQTRDSENEDSVMVERCKSPAVQYSAEPPGIRVCEIRDASSALRSGHRNTPDNAANMQQNRGILIQAMHQKPGYSGSAATGVNITGPATLPASAHPDSARGSS